MAPCIKRVILTELVKAILNVKASDPEIMETSL